MKKWLIWIRRHREDWPIFLSIVIGFLNTEIVTPFILHGIFKLSGKTLGLAAGTWASTELCWWNYFSGWLYQNKLRKINAVTEVISIGEAAKEFDWRNFLQSKKGDPYLFATIKDFIRKHSIDSFDPDNYKDDNFFNSLMSGLKAFGYILTCILIFVMSLLPLWWILALMVCRLLKWKLAYLALLVGNFLKNYWMALVYDKIGFWWWIMIFILSVIIMSYILKIIVKKFKQKNEAQ